MFYRIAQGTNEGYQLEISGLRELILLPAYDAAVVEGQLHMLEPMQMRSLEDLSGALTSYGIKESIDISTQQVDEFVQHVVPELRTLGHLSIDSQVREQIRNRNFHQSCTSTSIVNALQRVWNSTMRSWLLIRWQST